MARRCISRQQWIESDWLGELRWNDSYGVGKNQIPNAIMCLSNNLTNRNYDASGLGPGRDVKDKLLIDEDDNDKESIALAINNGCRIVHSEQDITELLLSEVGWALSYYVDAEQNCMDREKLSSCKDNIQFKY